MNLLGKIKHRELIPDWAQKDLVLLLSSIKTRVYYRISFSE